MFRQQGATKGRVRVTKRILSKKDKRGYQRVIAREGEILSVRDAFQRGIPESSLEPVGPGGKVAFAALKGARKKDADVDDVLARAERDLAGADRQALQEREQARADHVRASGGAQVADGEPAKEFPHHRGGGHYELSDGSVVQGKEDAEKAEAALHDDENAGEG
jgi:hypothetical protein